MIYVERRTRMTCCAVRLAYLGETNTLALLRLLPMSDRDKDAEILALRHQITFPNLATTWRNGTSSSLL